LNLLNRLNRLNQLNQLNRLKQLNQLNWLNWFEKNNCHFERSEKSVRMRTLVIIFLFTFTSGIATAQQSIIDIIKTDSCPGIEVSGEPVLYVGDDLFSLINGGAELYHEFGFAEVLAMEITIPGGDPLKAEIYDMGSPEAAWGIYSMTATSNAVPFQAGAAGRQGEGFSQFVKDKYMVYFYYQQVEQTELQYVAGCLARHIENYIPQPRLMTIVSAREEEADKIVYFKGNLGLSSLYSFHYKDVFGYSEGAAAIYPDLKVFLLKYDDEGSCIENYDHAREFFLNSNKYHDQLSLRGSFHMKDRKEQQIDCYFENTILVIFIYEGEMETNDLREKIVDSMQ